MRTQKTGSRISQRRQAAMAEGGVEYAARRARLIETAALVFREKGHASATLNDVAERFGTDRASLYYYIASKEELLHDCVARVYDNNLAQGQRIHAGPGTPRDKLTALSRLTIRVFDEHYPYVYVFIAENMNHIATSDSEWVQELAAKKSAYEELVYSLIQEGLADGSLRSDLPAPLLANALYGLLNWTHRWYTPDSRWSTDDLGKAFTSIFFDGAAAVRSTAIDSAPPIGDV